MFSIRDIIEALDITAKKLASEFGYTEKEVLDILDEKRKMSKIELLAFYKFTNISEDFFKGKTSAKTTVEIRIERFIQVKKEREELNNKATSFKNSVVAQGYQITDEEIQTFYDGKNNRLKATIVMANKPNLLLAIYKAFPDMKVEGEFFNSEYRVNGKITALKEIREKIIKLYTTEDWRTKDNKNKFSDSDIVYFAEPSSEWLMLFARGYFEWDNQKVLYLINKGAKYITVIGTGGNCEDTYPVFGEDIAITLLIKEYCEKHLS